jgi:hypothetical protein
MFFVGPGRSAAQKFDSKEARKSIVHQPTPFSFWFALLWIMFVLLKRELQLLQYNLRIGSFTMYNGYYREKFSYTRNVCQPNICAMFDDLFLEGLHALS